MSTDKVQLSEEKRERLKILIISTTKTASAFAAKLRLDKSLISMLVKGKANLTWRTEEAILSVFNVNRAWWEKGEGEIFNKATPDKGVVQEEQPVYQGLTRVGQNAIGALQGIMAAQSPEDQTRISEKVLELIAKEIIGKRD